MKETIYLNNLYDFYGSLLTSKQQLYFQKYYFDNLTMQEIADLYQISKNAVSKQIDLIKEKLLYYENNLKLYSKKQQINKLLPLIDKDIAKKIEGIL